ncbi:MAG TPA: hypothetical protein V6C46_03270 [Coleofasciculaceae cyanobacterium]
MTKTLGIKQFSMAAAGATMLSLSLAVVATPDAQAAIIGVGNAGSPI